jgi:hypothetical protein
MTDRELLELAAKAAGIVGSWEVDASSVQGREYFNVPYDNHNMLSGFEWNPLRDDCDALRLYTRLPFHELYVSEIGATVSWRRGDGSGHGYKCDEYADEHAGDINAATRRAIVRAAAEIGKAMP